MHIFLCCTIPAIEVVQEKDVGYYTVRLEVGFSCLGLKMEPIGIGTIICIISIIFGECQHFALSPLRIYKTKIRETLGR